MRDMPRRERPALQSEPLPKLLGFQKTPPPTPTGEEEDTRIHLPMASAGSVEVFDPHLGLRQ